MYRWASGGCHLGHFELSVLEPEGVGIRGSARRAAWGHQLGAPTGGTNWAPTGLAGLAGGTNCGHRLGLLAFTCKAFIAYWIGFGPKLLFL